MVNNQIEFNNAYNKEEVKEIEIARNRNFQGELVIEDYSELETLNLREVKSIEKIVLKNLVKLQECAIWKCNTKALIIENCPQIKKLNVRRNLLTNLEFIKDLDNLETLELDGNDELSEVLEPYEDDWKVYQKDLQESNEDTQELLRKIRVLEKEKELLNIKYDELKKFLKKILVSLSQEEKKELSVELDKKIKRRASLSAPGMTNELVLNTEKVIKSLKEIKKELENELVESKTKVEELQKKLGEQNSLYQQKEIELITQKSFTEELKKLFKKVQNPNRLKSKGGNKNLKNWRENSMKPKKGNLS